MYAIAFDMKIDDLKRLCEFYNLSADYLIGLTDEIRENKTED